MVPYLTACLITMVALAIPFNASAEQRLVDVMFGRGVVNRELVGVFETGGIRRLGNGKKDGFL